jgi:putative ABC transport system permease protein
VFARARDTARTSSAEDRARATMRGRRRLQPGVADTFDLLSPDAARGFVSGLTERVSAAALPLSAMALLASIVVVTNTTLVSVTQRTREIGVRRALGATRRHIVGEVLLESTLIALVGGAAGLLVVLAASSAVGAAANVPLALTIQTALWSVGSAALAGILAGLYPAQRAARIDIIAAVREE